MKQIPFKEGIINYVKTHSNYDSFTKEQAMEAVLDVLLGDTGATQEFLNELKIDVDLFG